MESNSLKWLISGICIVIISIIILILTSNSKEEIYFNEIYIPSTHHIVNKTDKKYLDTIVSAALTVIDFEPSVIIINQLDKKISFDDELGEVVLHAFIEMSPSSLGNQYIIYISDLPKEMYIDVLSHEMIHLIQYETGHLRVYANHIMWNNKIYTFDNMPNYFIREWEQEARGLAPILEDRINEILIPIKDDTER